MQPIRGQQKIHTSPARIIAKDEHGTNLQAYSPAYHGLEVERSRSVDSAGLDKNVLSENKTIRKENNKLNNAKPTLDVYQKMPTFEGKIGVCKTN